jgi:Uncharacterized protein conserved in bacteria (DUF2188)
MNTKSKHVVPNSKGGWSVHTTGASRASRVFVNQQDAVKYARTAAQKGHAELYIHRSDGTISSRDSYKPSAPAKSTKSEAEASPKKANKK